MKMARAMSYVADDLIAAAAETPRKRRNWVKWGAAAACLALVITAALWLPGRLFGGQQTGEQGRYKMVSPMETMRTWPWAYRTVGEKFSKVDFQGTEYSVRWNRPVDAAALGEVLGTVDADGVDEITEESYTETLEIRAIPGTDPGQILAAGVNGEYYVYRADRGAVSLTLGEAMEWYGLPEHLRFEGFEEQDQEDKTFLLPAEDKEIWDILAGCRDAVLTVQDNWSPRDQNGIVHFTVSAEELGIYRRVLYISPSGTLATNILDYQYTCEIGAEAAERILRYAREHGVAGEPEPYEVYVAGVVVEWGDDYLLLDDTSICRNPADGIAYRIDTDNLRVRRNIDLGEIHTGDIVVIPYSGEITDEHEIHGAYDVFKVVLMDGGVAVPE